MNIAKMLRTASFIEQLQRLFLNIFIIFLYFLMFTNSNRMTCVFPSALIYLDHKYLKEKMEHQ